MTRFSDGRTGDTEIGWRGVVDYTSDRSSYVMTPGGCRTIMIGDVTYSELPRMLDGKRWARDKAEEWDAEAAFEQSRAEEAAVEQSHNDTTSSYDVVIWESDVGIAVSEPGPDEYLEYLRDHATPLMRQGDEEVRGVATTHYRTTVDLQRLLRRELEDDGWKAANVDQYLAEQGVREQQVDVWLDDASRARRVVTSETSDDFATTTTTEFFEFGIDTDIEAPPESEVIDGDEWLRNMEEQREADLDALSSEDGIAPLRGGWEAYPPEPDSCLD